MIARSNEQLGNYWVIAWHRSQSIFCRYIKLALFADWCSNLSEISFSGPLISVSCEACDRPPTSFIAPDKFVINLYNGTWRQLTRAGGSKQSVEDFNRHKSSLPIALYKRRHVDNCYIACIMVHHHKVVS